MRYFKKDVSLETGLRGTTCLRSALTLAAGVFMLLCPQADVLKRLLKLFNAFPYHTCRVSPLRGQSKTMNRPVAKGVSQQACYEGEGGRIERGRLKGRMRPFKQNMTLEKPRRMCDPNPPRYHISSCYSHPPPTPLSLLFRSPLRSPDPFLHRCVVCHDRDDKLARVLLLK